MKFNKKNIKKIINGFFGKGVYPAILSFWLDFPSRKILLHPKKLSQRLHLKENHKVLEIGCGPGYFSPEIAKRLLKGHLFLLDIQKEMLNKAQKKLKKAGLSNISFVRGNAIYLPFVENYFDVVFLVTVLGEINSPQKSLKEILRVLKPSGILSITEQIGDPDRIAFKILSFHIRFLFIFLLFSNKILNLICEEQNERKN